MDMQPWLPDLEKRLADGERFIRVTAEPSSGATTAAVSIVNRFQPIAPALVIPRRTGMFANMVGTDVAVIVAGSAVYAPRYGIIVIDNLWSHALRDNPQRRAQLHEWFQQDLLTCLNPSGRVIAFVGVDEIVPDLEWVDV